MTRSSALVWCNWVSLLLSWASMLQLMEILQFPLLFFLFLVCSLWGNTASQKALIRGSNVEEKLGDVVRHTKHGNGCIYRKVYLIQWCLIGLMENQGIRIIKIDPEGNVNQYTQWFKTTWQHHGGAAGKVRRLPTLVHLILCRPLMSGPKGKQTTLTSLKPASSYG